MKVVGACIYDVLVIALILIFQFTSLGAKEGTAAALGQSFAMGAITGIMFVMVIFMRKYIMALRHEEKLKALFIEENDERNKFIYAKIGGAGMNIAIMSATLSVLIAAFFNETVFVTLIGVTVYISFVKLFLKIYYNKKY